MGYFLLWIESLTCGLLYVALVLACVARIERRWLQMLVGIPLVLLAWFTYGVPTVSLGVLEARDQLRIGLFWPMLLLFVALLAGSMDMLRRTFARPATTGETFSPRSEVAQWSRPKLALALGAAIALHAMTFSNMDASVKQSLAALRHESTTLSLSVAPKQVPDRDNAALLYRQVFDAMRARAAVSPLPQVFNDSTEAAVSGKNADGGAFDFQDPQLVELLQDQAGQLTLLRQAAARPECFFDRDYVRPRFDMLLPEYGHLRNASRLLAVHARHAADKHQLALALTDINAMYALARHASAEPLLVSMLVSAALDEFASQMLEAVLQGRHATAAELMPEGRDAVSIEPGLSYALLLDRSMRMEEALVLSFFGSLEFADNDSGQLSVLGGDPALRHFAPLYRVFLLSEDVSRYRDLMHYPQQFAAQPYAENRDKFRQATARQDNERTGIVTRLLAPALGAANEAAARVDARRRVAQVGLGMHRFHATQGKFPQSLAELTASGALTLAPSDPYDNKPIRLALRPKGWVVYSIGPDLADNGGQPFDNEQRTGDFTFSFSEPQVAATVPQ